MADEIATISQIKVRAADAAYERHNGVLPDSFRLYFRRYGKHGGRWRGVGPHGWVECGGDDREAAMEHAANELWWMVAAFENDQSHAARSHASGS